MSKVIVCTPEELTGLIKNAIQEVRATEAPQQPDRWLRQHEAAKLLAVTPQYFSAARLWEHIKHSFLPGKTERRYLLSSVLAYSPTDKTKNKQTQAAPHSDEVKWPVVSTEKRKTGRRGRPSMVVFTGEKADTDEI